jgi:hypothetical protein
MSIERTERIFLRYSTPRLPSPKPNMMAANAEVVQALVRGEDVALNWGGSQ